MARESLSQLLQRVGNTIDDNGEEMSSMERQLRIMNQTNQVSTRDATRRLSMAALRGMNNQFFYPVTQGLQLPFNPMSFSYTLGNSVQIAEQYQVLEKQSKAFLNSGGREVVNPESLERFKDAFSAIGATKGDVLQGMQQMAMISQQLSGNLDRATQSAMNFAKANGLQAGTAIAGAGTLARNMGVTLNADTSNRMLENIRLLAGGNNARFEPTLQAVTSLQEGTIQSGAMVRPDGRFTDNAMQLLSGFQRLNPELYGSRPDVAVQQAGRLQEAGKGMLLGFAMDYAASKGLPTDIASVYAMLENNDPGMMGYIGKTIGSDAGLSEAMVLSRAISGNFALDLRKNPNAFEGGFNPLGIRSLDDQAKRAGDATTATDKMRAGYVNSLQDTGNLMTKAVNTFSSVVDLFGNYVTMLAVSGVAGLAGSAVGRAATGAGLGALRGAPAAAGAAARAAGAAATAGAGLGPAGMGGASSVLNAAGQPLTGARVAGAGTLLDIAASAGTSVPSAAPTGVLDAAGQPVMSAARTGLRGFLGKYTLPIMGAVGFGHLGYDLYKGYTDADYYSDARDGDIQLQRLKERRPQGSRKEREAEFRAQREAAKASSAAVANDAEALLKSRKARVERMKAADARGEAAYDSSPDAEPDELRISRQKLEAQYGVEFSDFSFARSRQATINERAKNGSPLGPDAPNSHRVMPDGTSRSGDYMRMRDKRTKQYIDPESARYQSFMRAWDAETPNFHPVPEGHIPSTIHMQGTGPDSVSALDKAAKQTAMSLQTYSNQMDMAVLQQRYAAASALMPGTRLFG